MKIRFPFLLALGAVLQLGIPPASAATEAKHEHSVNDRVAVFDSTEVAEDETVRGDNVTVFGSADVEGHVRHDCVTVFGNAVINGTVDHDVVCVFGSLTLGPNAHVGHDVVCSLGELHRDPEAYVGGAITNTRSAHFGHSQTWHEWWGGGLNHGRFLVFGPHLGWLWVLSLVLLGLYALVALLFPVQVRAGGDVLVRRPGLVIGAGIAALFGLPIAFLLLCCTIIGIPVALLLLPLAILLPIIFGRAAFYSMVGRRLFGDRFAPAPAVLLGGAVCMLLLLLPFIGVLCILLIHFLSWGCAWATLLEYRRANRAAALRSAAVPPIVPPPPPAPVPPVPPVYSVPPVSPDFSGHQPPPPEAAFTAAAPSFTAAPPPLVSAALPRAGFWIRTGAMAIDVAMIGILCGMLSDASPLRWIFGGGPGPFLLACATYAAILWKVKSSTIGGLICHLQVVRIDGRPIDWSTAIVRALGCFISLFAAGFGFIWVAFDDERQSWHDKIAGTTVVIPPRRQSLV